MVVMTPKMTGTATSWVPLMEASSGLAPPLHVLKDVFPR